MKLIFFAEQAAFMRRILHFDPLKDLDDDELFKLEDKIADHLQMYGLADDDVLNETGQMCEDILAIIGQST